MFSLSRVLYVVSYGGLLLGQLGSSAALAQQGVDMDEVVVTAEKRAERLQDVPVPVSVISPETLAERDRAKLQDYFATVPGFNLESQGNGQTTLAIRGITTGTLTNPAVGVTIDDVPFGSSTVLGYGARLFPDIDPSDLSQIEVLRGPQGTLYGSSSIGGLIKIVSAEPSTAQFGGRFEADDAGIQHGADGFGVRGSINVPLGDELAVRASAFARHDPGFVDDPTQGRTNVNGADAKGGRVSALWRPSDSFSLKLSAMLQNTDGDGTSEVDANYLLQPTLGDLNQGRLRGTGDYSTRIQLYSATATAAVGGLTLTSVSGFGINKYYAVLDASQDYGADATALFNTSGAALIDDFQTRKFTQELRLASPSGHELEWLVGAFYTHEETPAVQTIEAIDPDTGQSAGIAGRFPFPTTFVEYATFADLTVHFAPVFDVQFGARESQNRQGYSETDTGPLVGGTYVNPTAHTQGNAFTYLLTPRYKVSPELSLYARLASGYRAGGPNPDASLFNFPQSYRPDKTMNYELGVKEDLLDRRLSFDASVYYIDWRDIQIQLRDPASGFAYFVNGGTARSDGVELSLQGRPSTGLAITAAATLGDAKLTQDLPPGAGVGFDGDRLPFSSRVSGSIAVDQDFRLTGNVMGFVGTSASYVGDRYAEFAPSEGFYRAYLPGYLDVDLHAGTRVSSWTTTVFITNVGDRRGILGGGPRGLGGATPADPFFVNYIRPRTFGISASRNF
jgi:iron complex outermembrane recepter protein